MLDDKASLFASLAGQVHQRQGDDPKRVLFLSDGERALWKPQQCYLPEAIGILDLWHVMEYLRKGDIQVWRDRRPQQSTGKVARVLPRWGEPPPTAATALRATPAASLQRLSTNPAIRGRCTAG